MINQSIDQSIKQTITDQETRTTSGGSENHWTYGTLANQPKRLSTQKGRFAGRELAWDHRSRPSTRDDRENTREPGEIQVSPFVIDSARLRSDDGFY